MPEREQGQTLDVESIERWVAGKSEEELLVDLKAYLARLRDDPRSIQDRLRVAAIQRRLGRSQEALIHYEGVLRGYVDAGRVMEAIALCQRILAHYPSMPRIQRVLAALYARAPHGATGSPSPVTPIPTTEELTTTFVVEEDEEAGTDRNVVVESVFPEEVQRRTRVRTTPWGTQEPDDARPTVPYETVEERLGDGLDQVPTVPHIPAEERTGPDAVVPLTRAKQPSGQAPAAEPPDDGELVVLLTKKKKRKNKKKD